MAASPASSAGRFPRPAQDPHFPLNESKDDTSQIEEYLKKYKGEGIQHIAVGTGAIYDATDKLAANGLKFMPGPGNLL